MSSEKSWKVESVDLSTKRTSSYFTVQSSMRKSNRPAGLRVHRPAGLRVHRAAGLRVHRPALLCKFHEYAWIHSAVRGRCEGSKTDILREMFFGHVVLLLSLDSARFYVTTYCETTCNRTYHNERLYVYKLIMDVLSSHSPCLFLA